MLSATIVVLAAVATGAVASGSVGAMPKPYLLSLRAESDFSAVVKRLEGYQPTETACKPGNTCAESCGAGYETCDDSNNPAPEFAFYCFNPTIGDTCCSDKSGHSCSAGYFCTKDTTGNTWCCPDGLDLVSCAAAYSLTAPLSSLQQATPAPTGSASASASDATATSSVPLVTASYTATYSPPNNTYTRSGPATTSTGPVQVAGASAEVAQRGLPVLAAGLVGLLWFL